MPVLRRAKQRKILRKLRHPQACSQLRLYKLRVETLGGTGYAEILPGVRQAPPGSSRGLDLQLRRGEQGQVLLRMRREEARLRAAVSLRQVRLGAQ